MKYDFDLYLPKIILYFSIFLVILIIIFSGIEFYNEEKDERIYRTFCIENNFEGYKYKKDVGYVCYNETPHESGIGIKEVYSGRIDR